MQGQGTIACSISQLVLNLASSSQCNKFPPSMMHVASLPHLAYYSCLYLIRFAIFLYLLSPLQYHTQLIHHAIIIRHNTLVPSDRIDYCSLKEFVKTHIILIPGAVTIGCKPHFVLHFREIRGRAQQSCFGQSKSVLALPRYLKRQKTNCFFDDF